MITTSNDPKLTYRFTDSSVPPEYHRSYTIEVQPTRVVFSVDVYGKVLANISLPLPASAYQSFVKDLQKTGLKNKPEINLHPMPGSTSDSLEMGIDGNPVKGTIYHGGGKSLGNLGGDVSTAVQLFKSLVPDLAKRIRAAGNDNIERPSIWKRFWSGFADKK